MSFPPLYLWRGGGRQARGEVWGPGGDVKSYSVRSIASWEILETGANFYIDRELEQILYERMIKA